MALRSLDNKLYARARRHSQEAFVSLVVADQKENPTVGEGGGVRRKRAVVAGRASKVDGTSAVLTNFLQRVQMSCVAPMAVSRQAPRVRPMLDGRYHLGRLRRRTCWTVLRVGTCRTFFWLRQHAAEAAAEARR